MALVQAALVQAALVQTVFTNGQAVSSYLTEASIMVSSNSHRSDLSCN